MTRHTAAALLALVGGLLPVTGPAAAATTVVGKTGAVNPAAEGAIPGEASRTLELGENIIFKERITTAAGSTVQLLFVDKSTMSIGQNASVVIDEFVYDPSGGAGRMAVSLTRGALRFVGGETSHTTGASVVTPNATIGIRGGIATIRYDARAETTRAVLHFGFMTVTTPGGLETVRRPGYEVTVSGKDAPASPVKATLAEIAQDRSELTSQARQQGSAPVIPTDQGAVRAGISTVNRGVTTDTGALQRSAATTRDPNGSTTLYDLKRTAQGSTTSGITAQAAGRRTDADVQVISDRGATVTPPISTPPPADVTPPYTTLPPVTPPEVKRPAPPAARFALNSTIDPALRSTVPYVLGAAVANGSVSVGPVYGYRAASPDGVTAGPTRTLQVAFGLDGSHSGQTSNLLVATSTLRRLPSGESTFDGAFVFTGRGGAVQSISRASGTSAAVSGGVTLDGDGVPTSVAVNQNVYDNGVVKNSSAFARPIADAPGQTYGFQQTQTATTPPNTLGQARQTNSFGGWAAGLVETFSTANRANIELPQAAMGVAALQTDAGTSRVQLDLSLGASHSGRPAGAYLNGYHQFGNVDTAAQPRGTYIDDSTFGALSATTAPDGSAASGTPLSLVNGAALTGDNGLAVVSSAIPNLASSFPGVNLCQCEYTRWGFWSDDTARPGYADRFHLGTWVAGTVTPTTDMPTTGTASYTGQVIAAIRSGTANYVAGGNMTNVANFSTRSVTSQVTNLDGLNYAGAMNYSGNVASGTLASGSFVMSTVGNFYGPAARELAGAVTVSGPGNYAGAGIFQTRR